MKVGRGMGSTDILAVRNLAVSFATPAGKVEAVKDLSFAIAPSKCVAIVGESGSGKSVTARAILGILAKNATIERGTITFSDPATPDAAPRVLTDIDPQSKDYRAIRGGRISMIFQEPMTSLSPLHTIGDQIIEMLELHSDMTGPQRTARAIDMLKLVRFPNPDRALKSYPFELSGGLRQRAMIAMAMICNPALLIADEPTTALDVTVQAQILGLIKDIQGELGMAVLLITHDMGVVANMADDVVVVYRGERMEAGPLQALLDNPQHPYLKSLLAAVPRMGDDPNRRLAGIFDNETGTFDAAEPVSTGADVAQSEPMPNGNGHSDHTRVTGERALSVKDLRKTYQLRGDASWFGSNQENVVVAVDNASFDVYRGECLAIVGESGSGKTTIAKLIMGAVSSDTGSIKLYPHADHLDRFGHDLTAHSDGQGTCIELTVQDERKIKPIRRYLQYIFQDPFGSLNPRMTTYDILREPLNIHGLGTRAERDARVRRMMVDVGLDERFLNRYPHSFSGGQRQRIGIARSLMLEPKIVLCDEPVSALDVSTQAQILNLLKDLQRRLGLTYVFISHDFAVVNYIADRIAVMCRGRIVELAERSALFASPLHPYTRALLSCVPEPDTHRTLDFETILTDLATEPDTWDGPFEVRSGVWPEMVDCGNGHMVRAWDAGAARAMAVQAGYAGKHGARAAGFAGAHGLAATKQGSAAMPDSKVIA
ncbi:MAG: ABC transporter ATP-binding protein [Pseudomonadota bacterium]